jgi:hypothetical protein
MGEQCGEETFARQQPFAGSHQLAHQTLTGLRAVPEQGVHGDLPVLPDHRARFRDGAFARIELNFEKLQFLAANFELDVVGNVCTPLVAARSALLSGLVRFSRGFPGRLRSLGQRVASAAPRRCTPHADELLFAD